MGSAWNETSSRSVLPEILPIFPLHGALLLPGCRLPLNVFEPRFLQMIEDVIDGDRLIGMIQPFDPEADELDRAILNIGCAGRIASLRECGKGGYVISLVGVSRFEVVRELASDRLYRMVEASWYRFASDRRRNPVPAIDREELVTNLKAYFQVRGLEANWPAIENCNTEDLVNSLAMVCPFDAAEKQALLEANDLARRSYLVNALMNMAVLRGCCQSATVH